MEDDKPPEMDWKDAPCLKCRIVASRCFVAGLAPRLVIHLQRGLLDCAKS